MEGNKKSRKHELYILFMYIPFFSFMITSSYTTVKRTKQTLVFRSKWSSFGYEYNFINTANSIRCFLAIYSFSKKKTWTFLCSRREGIEEVDGGEWLNLRPCGFAFGKGPRYHWQPGWVSDLLWTYWRKEKSLNPARLLTRYHPACNQATKPSSTLHWR